MGVLIGIVAIIIYYFVVWDFVVAGVAPVGVVATTYIFIPLIFLPLVIGSITASARQKSRGRATIFVSAAIAVAVGVGVSLLANRIFTPGRADPIAEEASRESTWIARGQQAAQAKLKDPDSAQFRGVYFHRASDNIPITCGEINSKNSFGGYAGFQRFISAGSPELTYLQEQMDQSDFAVAWNRFCAD